MGAELSSSPAQYSSNNECCVETLMSAELPAALGQYPPDYECCVEPESEDFDEVLWINLRDVESLGWNALGPLIAASNYAMGSKADEDGENSDHENMSFAWKAFNPLVAARNFSFGKFDQTEENSDDSDAESGESFASKALGPFFAAKDYAFNRFDTSMESAWIVTIPEDGSIAWKALGPLVAARNYAMSKLSSDDSESSQFSEVTEPSEISDDIESDDTMHVSSVHDTTDLMVGAKGIKMHPLSATTFLAELDLSFEETRVLETVDSFLQRFPSAEVPPLETVDSFLQKISTESEEHGMDSVTDDEEMNFVDGKSEDALQTQSLLRKPIGAISALRLLEEALLRLASQDGPENDCDDDFDAFSPCYSPRMFAVESRQVG